MSQIGEVALATLLVLATSVWVGGIAALVVVASATRRTLSEEERVRTFRLVGRVWAPVAGTALVVGFVISAILTWGHPHETAWYLAVAAAAAVVLTTAAGIVQARALSALRRRALNAPHDEWLAALVGRTASRAAVLRGLIALWTLVLVVLGVIVAR